MEQWWPGETPFHIAIGAILTQNTTWTSAYRSLQNLINAKLDTPPAINNAKEEDIAILIRPSGFMKQKSKYLKNLSSVLCSKFQCCLENIKKAENPREELLHIKGIGKETADSILLYALDLPYFVVDAYTRRILSRMRIINEKEKYDKIAEIFVTHLPHDSFIYKQYHALLVEHAKRTCRKRNPLCEKCPLKHLCQK